MNDLKKQLIAILRAVVCRDGTPVPSGFDPDAMMALAKENHLETIVFEAAPEVFREKYEGVRLSMLARSARQAHYLELTEKALKDAGIHYGLLKGAILKSDYPEPYLRFMTDMDFYINPKSREAIKEAMISAGSTFTGTESGDDQFIFPGGIKIEMHGRLLYRKTKGDIEHYPAWEYVDCASDRLTPEGFALNIIGHAVYDLTKGGPGVRYILDLWVLRHLHSPAPDWDKVYEKLREDGICEAAKNLMDLSEHLFSGAQAQGVISELADYVLSSGLNGSARRMTAIELGKSGGRSGAFLRQLFRNRAEYENRYPWLKKHPVLFPVAVFLRIIDSLKTGSHRKRFFRWHRDAGRAEKAEIEYQKEFQKKLGL